MQIQTMSIPTEALAPQLLSHTQSHQLLSAQQCLDSITTSTSPSRSTREAAPTAITAASVRESLDILDIRGPSVTPSLSLRAKTLESLSLSFGSKCFPSLLLWNENGQRLFNEILTTSDYYPLRTEMDLVQQNAHDIAQKIVSSGSTLLVELGAGNMQKTALLLSALDALATPLIYYALDVDPVELAQSLTILRSRVPLRSITVRGLLGTYEDGARWLADAEEARSGRPSLLWLGTSIANFMADEATKMLALFSQAGGTKGLAGLYIAVDGCRDDETVRHAYDTTGGESRRFIIQVLESARQCLGCERTEFFKASNWWFEGRWDSGKRRYESHLIARKDMEANVDGKLLSVTKRESVLVIGSGKWSRRDVEGICRRPGLVVAESWDSQGDVDYGKVGLPPNNGS
jgi:EasF-like predicted methyltransferase